MFYCNIGSGIWKIDSEKPGKIVTLIAGIDGRDERGVRELIELVETLAIDSGKVYAILGNPQAIAEKKHSIEKDMHDTFCEVPTGSSYEDMRTQDILPYLRESDIVFFFEYGTSIAANGSILSANHDVWADCIEADTMITGLGGLRPHTCGGYVSKLEKSILQVEKSPKSKEDIFASIESLLIVSGNKHMAIGEEGKEIPRKKYTHKRTYHMDTVFRAPSPTFSFFKPWKNLDPVKMGEVIASHGKIVVRAPYDGVIGFLREPEVTGDAMCVFGKMVG